MKNSEARLQNIRIDAEDTILNAIKQMDKLGKKLLLVFAEGKFDSLLSIGDVQRAIIKNKSLDTPIRQILRKDVEVAYENKSKEEIHKRMLENRTECMPVLDTKGELSEVIFWEDIVGNSEKRIKRNLDLPVVIMAGGKGTRMRPITNVLPKPLIPLGEKSMIEQIMEKFIDIGCLYFYVTLNYKAEFIRQYFSMPGKDERANITFIEEEKFLGTAGSLNLLKNKISQTFFVSNCDILIDQDYGEIMDYHREQNNEMTIVAALKHYSIPYGILETGKNGALLSITEKPDFTFQINSGMYILEPHLLTEVPENKFFHITDLMKQIKDRKGRIGVFPVSEKSWKDIGNWEEYLKEIKD